MRKTNKITRFISITLLLSLVFMPTLHSIEVVVGSSPLKDVYSQGEELAIQVVVWNNGSSPLEILNFNISIWRVEKRYNKLRNVERVYNQKLDKNVTIEPNQQFSEEIVVKINLQPARYNLSLAVTTKFLTGAAAENTRYIIKSHLFWVKPSFEVPVLLWATIIEVILIGMAIFIYKRLR